jgi:hypothetical protein
MSTLGLYCLALCSVNGQDYYMPHTSHALPPAHSYAQHHDSLPKHAFFASLNFGISIPTGQFAAKDTVSYFMIPTNTDSTHAKGFANVGYHVNFTCGGYLTPNIGLVANLGYEHHSFDANTLNNIINGYYYYSIDGNYNIYQFMGGGFLCLPLNDGTSNFKFQAMIGGIYANYPNSTVSVTVTKGKTYQTENINFQLSNATDFAYSLGISFEQYITDNVSFTTGISYSGAELNYPNALYNYSGAFTASYYQRYPVSMSYGSFDISIGLAVHF